MEVNFMIQITDVRSLPGDSAFLIDDGKTAIMYDSGFAFTGYRVADKIKQILELRPLDYIFLTHSHYDHALGSVYAKKYWPSAKVVAGEYATKIFAKPTAKSVPTTRSSSSTSVPTVPVKLPAPWLTPTLPVLNARTVSSPSTLSA